MVVIYDTSGVILDETPGNPTRLPLPMWGDATAYPPDPPAANPARVEWECHTCARIVDLSADDYCPVCGEPLPDITGPS